MYPDYFLNEISDEEEKDQKEEKEEKEEIKYEDKYLEEIRKLSKEFQFDKEEEETKTAKYIEYWKELIKNNAEKIAVLIKKLNKITKKLDKIEKEEDEYYVYSDSSESSNETTFTDKKLLEEKELLLKEIRTLQTEIDTEEGQNAIIQKAHEMSYEFVVTQRLEKIRNCYIMEYTPLGNVLMIYDTSRSTFKYFSDNSIPYRYLETVARKYVKCYNCRPIFVDM
jgi:DNA repair exonuclease SbcCD ATPase subunit